MDNRICSFPEITDAYKFKKGKECFQEGHYKAARMYLATCAHSEDLTFAQRQEVRESLDKIRKIQTNV
ncbi:MAG TPA: hypothetical protein VJ485_01955 [archaeon]|nr:hypothetical protein [archaeon]